MSCDFVHLHVHSCYSLLRGASGPEALVDAARSQGMGALALTDTDGLYGIMPFYKAATGAVADPATQATDAAPSPLRPILGIHLTQPADPEREAARETGRAVPAAESRHPSLRGLVAGRPRPAAVVLARTDRGFSALCRLATRRHLATADFDLVGDLLREASAFPPSADPPLVILTPHRSIAAALREAYPPGAALYLEIFHFGGPAERRRVRRTLEAARADGLPPVATSAVHFASREGSLTHRILRAIDENTSLSGLDEREEPPCEGLAAESPLRGWAEIAPPEAWLKPAAEMARLFDGAPEAISVTRAIAESCESRFDVGRVWFPEFPLPAGETPFSRLWKMAFAGATSRYRPLTAAVVERLRRELDVIERLGFSPYFLIVADILDFARREGIPFVGRGSAADSLVSYALGITNVDPIALRLDFERFLNPERTTPPDIDLDFCWQRRDEVVRYVTDRYGADRVAMISTHVTFAARSAVREVAKVLGVPDSEISGFTKRLPWFSGAAEIGRAIERVPECRDLPVGEEPWKTILAIACALDGFPRHLSVHPGGLVLAPGPLTSRVPLERAAKGFVVTQYDMHGVEDIGLLKIDLLCQRSLSGIVDARRMIRARGFPDPPRFDEPGGFSEITRDPDTRRLLREGRTMGCFYIESPRMRTLLPQLGADTFEMLTCASSIVRPGVADSGMMGAFIRRHLGKEAPQYLHPRLEELLGETYGIMIYQEDVLRVVHHLVGLSLAEADLFRRAMSGKMRSSEAMRRLDDRFFSSAREHGLDDATAREIWRLVQSFAGYSFCKAHSASYAQVSFQVAWLKAHYPAEFLAAVLTNQGGFYHPSAYVEEARRLGLRLLLPDINRGAWEYTVDRVDPDASGLPLPKANAIRIGLLQVRGLPREATAALLAEREARGAFTSLGDFLRRLPDFPPSATETLIKVGAFDTFEWTRPELLWKLEYHIHGPEGPRARRADRVAETARPLLPLDLRERVVRPDRVLPRLPDYTPEEKLRLEMDLLEMAISDHPLALWADAASARGTVAACDLRRHAGRRVRVLGWLVTVKPVRTRSGELMKFMTFEDRTGLVEATLFPEAYRRAGTVLAEGGRGPFLVEGTVEVGDGGVAMLAIDTLRTLPEARARAV